MTSLDDDLARELEKIGEAEVRTRLSRGEFGMVGSSKSTAVEAWLNSRESERRTALESKALSNAEEAYSTARTAHAAASEALFNSREAMTLGRLSAATSHRANVIAIVAMICSAVAITIALIIAIYK
ncbi:MAG TPA: hypothetical protein VF182_04670 [Candidatus Binatia bacterium]